MAYSSCNIARILFRGRIKITSTFFSIFIGLFILGCATPPASVQMLSDIAPISSSTISTPFISTQTTHPPLSSSFAFFYQLHPLGNPTDIIRLLNSNTDFKCTLVFPPKYFSSAERKETLQLFKILRSSGQIEIALTLENEPPLPLLANLRLADRKVQQWGFNYLWPEDVSAQLALGSSRYQMRWNELPSGFVPPYLALSDMILPSLQRFRLNWVLGPLSEQQQIFQNDGLVIVCPPEYRTDDWGDLTTETIRKSSVITQLSLNDTLFFDAGKLPEASIEKIFFREIIASIRSSGRQTMTGLQWANLVIDGNYAHSEVNLPEQDWSTWVASPKQKVAWQALAQTRQVLDNYQNSGRANLSKLDVAQSELLSAQSGAFLYSLANSEMSSSLNEKTFTATLANVYRLCGAQVPPSLHTLFTRLKIEKVQPTYEDPDRLFFIEGSRQFIWNDPRGDDNGGGNFLSPVGNYPKGAFDIDQFNVSWDDESVTLLLNTLGPVPTGTLPLKPGIDIYIDVNRLPNAGEQHVFQNRGNAGIHRDAAWEYAVVVSPKQSSVYMAVPGASNRLVASPSVQQSGSSMRVQLSRNILRGDPKNWRFTVALFGAEYPSTAVPIKPSPVLTNPTTRNFGGASSGRHNTVYIDLLAAPGEQQTLYIPGESGGRLILPFVEGP